ncbi:MAG TPA: hypothetical protein VMT44_00700 [Methanoregula sp.]|nr:hypothetical protein [Methanoregula sp.]
MFEQPFVTRAAICGTGLLLALIFLCAGFPVILLVIPVAVLFLGLMVHQNLKEEKNPQGFFDRVVADPEETHAVWYGMLNTLGIFDISGLAAAETATLTEKKHYFWFGEAGMAALLAGVFAAPLGMFLAEKADATLAFIGATMVFLFLFIFLPKLVRIAMMEDPEKVIAAFGRNEHAKKVFWTLFLFLAGLVLARIVDPATAQQVVGILTGM